MDTFLAAATPHLLAHALLILDWLATGRLVLAVAGLKSLRARAARVLAHKKAGGQRARARKCRRPSLAARSDGRAQMSQENAHNSGKGKEKDGGHISLAAKCDLTWKLNCKTTGT